MEIKYELEGMGRSVYIRTECPYFNFTLVGSVGCVDCDWFESADYDKQIVECLFEEKNK